MELIPCRSAIDYIRCGYEVPGMILFLYLEGAMRPPHVSACVFYDLNALTEVLGTLWH